MPQCDGTSIDIDLIRVKAKVVHNGYRLTRERFVQLDDVDVVLLQSGALQGTRNGIDGANTHHARLETGNMVGTQLSDGFNSKLFQHLLRYNHNEGRAVRGL